VTESESALDLNPHEVYEYPFAFIIPRQFRDQVVMEMTMSPVPRTTGEAAVQLAEPMCA
jgi:hypothetical protein